MTNDLPPAERIRCYVTEKVRVSEALALEEAIFERVEDGGIDLFVYLWEPAETAVVLGSACRAALEVAREACLERGIAVRRRFTGGGTVVVGPFSWCYAFVFSKVIDAGTIQGTFSAVHEVIRRIIAGFGLEVRSEPLSDLAVERAAGEVRKVAGHGQKRRRSGVLCDGTLLARAFPFDIESVLPPPPREPPYRKGRSHAEFLTNLKEEGVEASFRDFVRAALAFLGRSNYDQMETGLRERARELARRKYEDPAWTERL